MRLTLQDFRAVAGSASSIGFVALKEGGSNGLSLQKVANHKTLTSKNVLPTDDAGGNLRTREAFYTAIKTALGGQKDVNGFLASVRKQLGVNEEAGGPAASKEGNRPLDRRTVRALVEATMELAQPDAKKASSGKLTAGQKDLVAFATGKSDGSALGTDLLFGLYQGIGRLQRDKLSDVWTAGIRSGESLRLTSRPDGSLRLDLGPTSRNLDPVRLRYQCAMAIASRKDAPPELVQSMLKDFQDLFQDNAMDFTAWTGLMSPEIQAVREVCQELLRQRLGESVSAEKLSTVSPHLMSRLAVFVCEGGLDADSVNRLIDLYTAPRLTAVEVQDLMERYAQAPAALKGKVSVGPVEVKRTGFFGFLDRIGNALSEKPLPPDAVQNMLADIVSDAKTFLADRHPAPGERLKETLLAHVDALAALLSRPDEEIAKLPEQVRGLAGRLVEGVREQFGTKKYTGAPLARLLEFGLKTEKAREMLGEIEARIDEETVWACRKMQHEIMGSFDAAMTGKKSESNAVENDDGYDQLVDLLKDEFSDVPIDRREALLEEVDRTVETLIRSQMPPGSGKGLISIVSQSLRNAKMDGTAWDEAVRRVGRKMEPFRQNDVQISPERPQAKVEEMGVRAFMAEQGLSMDSTEGDGQKTVLEASRELLDKLGNDGDLNHGYGAFMKTAMWRYLRQTPVVDRRAMLAAGIRFGKSGDGDMKRLAACMKGAGPIMQKMLQGLASMDIDAEFAEALDDMKSNLPEIPKDVVEAYLFEVMRQSKGAITDIRALETLGAASVGQTVLCEVTLAPTEKSPVPEKRQVVVKMLRPEIEARLEHEKQLFVDASKEVPGMETTIAEQLAGILEELDFRNEARNIDDGKAYDVGAPDVKSMKRLALVEPTKRLLVLEKAAGKNVSRMLRDAEAKIDELTGFFCTVTNQTDEKGKTVKTRTVNVRVPQDRLSELPNRFADALLGLSELYEQLHVHQKRLVELARKWTLAGIYRDDGYFHGDLHAGNIMVDADEGLTIIDFGNATHLTREQQASILRMMNAAALRDTNQFMKDFASLMSPEGRARFTDPQTRETLHNFIHNILNLGNETNAADRIFAILLQLQQRGYELPGPIFKFSQCAVRLQGTIRQTNDLMKKIVELEQKIRGKALTETNVCTSYAESFNPVAAIFDSSFNGDATENDAFQVAQDVDKALKDIETGYGLKPSVLSAFSTPPPADVFGVDAFAMPQLVVKELKRTMWLLPEGDVLRNEAERAYEVLRAKLGESQNLFVFEGPGMQVMRRRRDADAYRDGLLLEKDKAFRKDYEKLKDEEGPEADQNRQEVVNAKIDALRRQLIELRRDEKSSAEDIKTIQNQIIFLSKKFNASNSDFHDVFNEAHGILVRTMADPEVEISDEKFAEFAEEQRKFAEHWTGAVMPALDYFLQKCEEGEAFLLNNLKERMASAVKVEGGKPVRKFAARNPDGLKTFDSAVGDVLNDNLVCSALKQGLIPTAVTLLKLYTPFTGYTSEPKE